jgi:hypothetical protein
VVFLNIEDKADLPPHQCHFYGRLGDELTLACLDFESDPPEDRLKVLTRFRDDTLVPLADQCSTKAGAVAFLSSGVLRIPLVLPAVRSTLGLDRP